jgi:aminoglycoside phosphotransferase (APT) family kinase protein
VTGEGDPVSAADAARLAEQLQSFLQRRWDDPDARVLAVAPFGDGHSGFTYLVDLQSRSATGQYVMRVSPPGVRIAGNADIGRQGRIMAALHAAGIPTPDVLVADSTSAMAGRAIAITERIRGVDWRAAAARHDDEWLMSQAVDVLHRWRSLTPAAAGLPDDEPQSALEDLARWTRLLERAPGELHVAGHRLVQALLAAPPVPAPPSLVHGDYHYGNLLFGSRGVVGVLDWEVAGIGDPRWDFGSLAVASIRRKYDPEPNPTGGLDVSLAELARSYGEREDLAWFAAASCLKYAAILGYNLGLHLKGRRPDPIYEQLRRTISGLAADGLEALAAGIG